jgi:hypothetical protein
MKHSNQILITAVLAFGLGLSATAQESQDTTKGKMLDPRVRAEAQCATLKAEAATGTEADKKKAERKCIQALEWAKEMIAKKAKEKPESDSKPDF